jgi:hypothetical protein
VNDASALRRRLLLTGARMLAGSAAVSGLASGQTMAQTTHRCHTIRPRSRADRPAHLGTARPSKPRRITSAAYASARGEFWGRPRVVQKAGWASNLPTADKAGCGGVAM